MFPSNLVLPPIPDPGPRVTEALASLRLFRLSNALLDGYPFADPVSRAVALSLQMTQVLRCAMTVCPMHAISATAPCSGKSHLVDPVLATSPSAASARSWVQCKSDEETEKGINTKSDIRHSSVQHRQRVHHALDIPALNIATERPLITIRVFGTLTDVEIENAVSIYMTGNNLPIIDEQMRRTVRCVLDAEIERPELRPFLEVILSKSLWLITGDMLPTFWSSSVPTLPAAPARLSRRSAPMSTGRASCVSRWWWKVGSARSGQIDGSAAAR